MSGEIATVYAVFATIEEAERIGAAMVEARLAACVNILPGLRSIYRWEGAVTRDAEVAALFKTRATLAPALIAQIAAHHSYAVPAAVAWPIPEVFEDYRNWVLRETEQPEVL